VGHYKVKLIISFCENHNLYISMHEEHQHMKAGHWLKENGEYKSDRCIAPPRPFRCHSVSYVANTLVKSLNQLPESTSQN